jgi:hypothetical protein
MDGQYAGDANREEWIGQILLQLVSDLRVRRWLYLAPLPSARKGIRRG